MPAGSGGSGGGGAGSNSHQIAATPGDTNTGGGGGSEGYNNQPPGSPINVLAGAGAGGSGFVVLKVPSAVTGAFTPGVTQTLSTAVPGFNIYTVTATSTSSETVKFTK